MLLRATRHKGRAKGDRLAAETSAAVGEITGIILHFTSLGSDLAVPVLSTLSKEQPAAPMEIESEAAETDEK